ncbi:hypothetical protein ACFLXY_05630 [Chloroflexota bacterium]
MVDLGILGVIIWVGCFLVVSVDSVYKKINPVFWRLAALFGGPFALLAYGIIRERRSDK